MNQEERDNKIDYLREHVSKRALYEQFAEESCELGQAALKYIRAIGNGNPTPMKEDIAYSQTIEEAMDVYLCMIILDIFIYPEALDKKLERWYNRVKEVNDE